MNMHVEDLSEIDVGIANLPNQVHRKSVRKGFDFNLLVVGDYGIGKSTFLNMLFESDLYTQIPYEECNREYLPFPQFKSTFFTVNENNVKLRMELIELEDIEWTDETYSKWQSVSDYITDRLDNHLKYEDSCVQNPEYRDCRIHCCLYFIPPLTHYLRPTDLKFLKTVSQLVNVIPLIAKCDTLNQSELLSFKSRIRYDLESHKIPFYKFPDLDEIDNYFYNYMSSETPHYDSRIPFAIAGSLKKEIEKGKSVYIRQYIWGKIVINDPEITDFELFQNLFFRTHLFHLIFYTKNNIYERYRTQKLCSELGLLNVLETLQQDNDSDLEADFLNFENEKKQCLKKLDELKIVFEEKLLKRETELKETYLEFAENQTRELLHLQAELEKDTANHGSPIKGDKKKNEYKKSLLKLKKIK